MKNDVILLNEKGSASIVFAALVTGLISVLVANTSSSGSTINSLHSSQKARSQTSQNIINLSLQFKQSYNLGMIDPTCSRFTNTTHREISGIHFCFPSADGVCVVSRDENNRNVRNCASVQRDSMFWQSHPHASGSPTRGLTSNQNPVVKEKIEANNRLLNGFGSDSDDSDGLFSGRGYDDDYLGGDDIRTPSSSRPLSYAPITAVTIRGTDQVPSNSITVPARTQAAWKACTANDLCIRVALCETNVTSCSEQTAVATQVVRLGPIN